MFRLAAAVLAGLLLAAASAAPAAQDEPKKLPGPKIALPEVDAFEKQPVKVYDEPGLGWSVSYRGSGSVVTFYVYNMDRDEVPDGPDSDAVKAEMLDVLSAVEAGKASGHYKTLTPVKDGVASLGSGKTARKFRFKRYEVEMAKGGPAITEAYLTGYKNHFVKLRTTYLAEGKAEAEAELKDLYAAITRAMK
ncbi:MAG TPA: hypothetical protein VKE74_02615 [Gemmataceae bacterium]|nr:hypothetical protein [Gemmataceae bacterium]